MQDEGDSVRSSRDTVAGDEAEISRSSLRSTLFGDFGTETLYQGSLRLSVLLAEFTKEVSRPQKELIDLSGQVKILLAVSHELNSGALDRNLGPTSDPNQDQLWQSVSIISQRSCDDTMDYLESVLERIKSIHESEPNELPLRLAQQQIPLCIDAFHALNYQTAILSVLQKAIHLGTLRKEISSDSAQEVAFDAATTLSSLVHRLNLDIGQAPRFYAQEHTEGIRDMLTALEVALSVARGMPTKSINRHLRVPRAANRIYTGRIEQLQAISRAFQTAGSTQKRFVVQGMPGSGKSDLALKYAEEHAMYYWGIFWIDASTRENAKESYAEIGKLGGVEPIMQAAKHWLAHLHPSYTWLLIIDNADDSELPLEGLFPPSVHGCAQGCILVTTRNPDNLDYGITGRLELREMADTEANALLLRAASIEEPWTTNSIELARKVCKHLHYLPLALLHAGKAIRNGLCGLATYIKFFDSQASRIRSLRYNRRDRSSSRSKKRTFEDEEHMSIFGSYEILYESLEGAATRDYTGVFPDALQLLQTFSYMHFQNIRLAVIAHAATCPLMEKSAREGRMAEEEETLERIGAMPQPPLSARFQNLLISIRRHRLLASPPAIPDVLKNPVELDAKDLKEYVEIRLRKALKVLVDRGLVNRGEDRDGAKRDQDRYHMHPIVHKWVRERPQLSVAEGALYCQMATTVLCRAVRLIGKEDEGELAMRRDMKPHIDNVLQFAELIRGHIQENRRRERKLFIWSMRFRVSEAGQISPSGAEEYGRFGRVYLECGAFRDAERLLRHVHGYLLSRLGPDHELTHRVKEGLAGALWNQTYWNQAAKLIREVYESRERTLGSKHPLTMDITNKLGQAVLSQGRITEALQLHEDAKASLTEVYGPWHKDTIKTIRLIGRCYFYRMDWEKSVELHKEASRGLRRILEDDPMSDLSELEVLDSEEDLAMGLLRLAKDDYEDALELITYVKERRTEILGKEAPFTLIATANYGRILSKCGRFREADETMGEVLDIGERNHGKDHLAVLAGKAWYAHVLMENGELERAGAYFREAIHKEDYKKAAADDAEHPDRIWAVWMYVQCLKKQGNIEEALRHCEELKSNIPLIGGKGLGRKHKFARMLPGIIEDLEKERASRQIQGAQPEFRRRSMFPSDMVEEERRAVVE